MSQLWSVVKVKWHRRIFSILLSSILSTSSFSFASQNETSATQVSREALFERAYKSLAFVMMMAGQDEVFRKWMTPEEMKAYSLILPVANEIMTLNWLEENRVQKNTRNNRDTYSYVISENRPVNLITESGTRVKLQFSDDQGLFDLKDGKPIRTAITTSSMKDDIILNLRKINHANRSVSLSDAFSILVHEFGRKVSVELAQSLGIKPGRDLELAPVDSLAGKLKNYLDSMVTRVEVPGGAVTILTYKYAPYDHWMEGFLFGHYQGVNIPKKVEPLIAYDKVGTFVLVETSKGTFDLTDSLFASELHKPHVKFVQDSYYTWTKLNWFLTSGFEVRESGSGKLRIELNVNQLQVVLPFWQPNSFHPESYQLYQRAFPTNPPNRGLFFNSTWEVDYRGAKPTIISQVQGPLKFESPRHQVELIRKDWQGDTLRLVYKIDGERSVTLAKDTDFTLWPELVLEYAGQRFEVRASSYDAKQKQYEFQVEGLRQANAGQVRITGIELTADRVNLAQASNDMRVRLFIPQIENVALEGTPQSKRPVLKSIMIWNGSRWISLQKNKTNGLIKGSHIRFVFEANEKLRSLSMLQSYEHWNRYSTELFPGTDQTQNAIGAGIKEKRSSWITISQADMTQELQDSKLFVDIELDKNVSKEVIHNLPIGLPDSIGKALPIVIAKETARSWVEGIRGIEVLRTVSHSMRVSSVQLKEALSFEINQKMPAPQKKSVPGSCEQFFQN